MLNELPPVRGFLMSERISQDGLSLSAFPEVYSLFGVQEEGLEREAQVLKPKQRQLFRLARKILLSSKYYYTSEGFPFPSQLYPNQPK
jgi:hypothetical protein